MIDLREAVKVAKATFADLFEGPAYSDLALEEVEMDDPEDYYFITLGYSVAAEADDTPMGRLAAALGGESPRKTTRQYRTFKISGDYGKVVSMKIRNPWAEPSRI